jgi:hypothetical protein
MEFGKKIPGAPRPLWGRGRQTQTKIFEDEKHRQ